MKTRFLGLVAGCLVLAACQTVPKDAPQSIYLIEGTLTAAIDVATQYAELPTCNGTVALCSDPATVSRIQAAASAATAAVLTAQSAVTAPGASAASQTQAVATAAQAVSELEALTATVKVK